MESIQKERFDIVQIEKKKAMLSRETQCYEVISKDKDLSWYISKDSIYIYIYIYARLLFWYNLVLSLLMSLRLCFYFALCQRVDRFNTTLSNSNAMFLYVYV